MKTDDFMQIAETAHFRGDMDRCNYRPMRVGGYYAALPQDVRDQCKSLSSSDLTNIRVDAIDHLLFPKLGPAVILDISHIKKRTYCSIDTPNLFKD